MSENERIGIEVELQAKSQQLDKAVSSLEEMSAAMGDIAKKMAAVSRQGDAMSKSIATSSQRQAEATKKLTQARSKLNQTWLDQNSNPHQQSYKDLLQLTRQQRVVDDLNKRNGKEWLQQLERIRSKYGEVAAAAIKAAQATGTGAGSARDVARRMQQSGNTSALPISGAVNVAGASASVRVLQQQRAAMMALIEPQRALVQGLMAEEAKTDRLTNARYAMFAAGATVAAGSYALGRALIFTVQAAMEYETALAQVSRTSDLTGRGLQQFAGELRDASSTIPLAFADIAEIATLGGQLNVPRERLADFTETVAQFGMTTDVTAGTAAEAFGRLDALLPDVQGNFDRLGSSILNVGVNSVATESDIIEVSTQIAAVGSQAGFSSAEVIGFAAAMRSVGIRPELARGGLTRVFGVISDAIAGGGAQLELFAQLSGRTADSFRSDWRDAAATTFQDLLRGMENARQSGTDLYQVMNQLGITNSRDRQVVAVLSQNYDLLAESIDYATTGFEDGTQLGAAFETQAATLASQLQMLINSFHALFAEIAEPSLALITPLVTMIANVVQGMTDFIDAAGPLKWVIAAFGALGTVGAGLGIAAGAFTLLTAAMIASRTAIRTLHLEMERERLERMEQNAGLTANTAAVTANTAAKARGAAGERAYAASVSGTTAALGAQSAAARSGMTTWGAFREVVAGNGQEFGRFGKILSGATSFLMGPWGIGITAGLIGVELLKSAIDSTAASTERWTDAITRGTSAAEMFRLASEKFSLINFDFQADAAKIPQYLSMIRERAENSWVAIQPRFFELDNSGFTHDLNQIEEALLRIGNAADQRTAFAEFAAGLDLSREQVVDLMYAMPELTAAMAAGGTEAELLREVYGQMIDPAGTANIMDSARALYELEIAAGDAGDEVVGVADLLANEFANVNVFSALGGAMRDFATGIAEGGAVFSAVTQAGAVNVANFQGLVEQSIAAGTAQGWSAAESINNLFAVLKANGIDVLALLASLRAQGVASIGGVDMSALTRSAGRARQTTGDLGEYMNTAFRRSMEAARTAANRAGRSLGGGGGRRPAKDSLAGGAAGAKEEVRTLVDYANDLRKVMDRAIEIRFGSAQAFDKITTGWLDIAEATQDARDAIRDANRSLDDSRAKLAELTADRSIQRYFLGIAEAYGDALRADKIRADLAKIDSDLAKEQDKVSDAQKERAEAEAELSKTLTGNSKAAIKNRDTIIGMVGSYQAYLLALAASGASQAELQAQASKLRNEFLNQGVAMGFSRRELDTYATAFQDFGTIISRVPYNVTVAMNADPALQALAEFDAEAEERAGRAGRSAGSAYGGGFGSGLGFSMPDIEDFFPDIDTGVEVELKPVVNRGNTYVPLRNGREIYDPEPGNTFTGGRGRQGGGGDFTREFDYGRNPAPFMETYGNNLGIALIAGLYNALVPADPVKPLTKPLRDKGEFTKAGTFSGTYVSKGYADTIAKGKVGTKLTNAVVNQDWKGGGSKIGRTVGDNLDKGFTQSRALPRMIGGFKTPEWGNKGRQLGSSTGKGMDTGFKQTAKPQNFLNAIPDTGWYSRGKTGGTSMGGGVKQGYSASKPAAAMLKGVEVNGWYSRGKSGGADFSSGLVKGGASEKLPTSLQNAFKNIKWGDVGYGAGKSIATGIKSGFNNNAPKIVAGSGVSAVRMFRTGGYTGGGSKDDIAGLVHAREFVMPAEATQSIGLPALEHMKNTGTLPARGVPMMPSVVMVELSPQDRALIAQGNNVVLKVDGRTLAQSTNNQNAGMLQRGTN